LYTVLESPLFAGALALPAAVAVALVWAEAGLLWAGVVAAVFAVAMLFGLKFS
jgi:hypothetical protein